jgi:hypothetical protein
MERFAFEGGVATEAQEGYVLISEEEYQAALDAMQIGQQITVDGGFAVREQRPSEFHEWENGEWVDHTPGPEPVPEPVTVLYPVDLWSRMTEAEASEVEAAMSTQTVRVQNIFKYASSYRSDHELWPLLETMATSLFGADRASEILSAS